MPERVPLDLLAARLQLGHDVRDAGPLGDEQIDAADLVHDRLEPHGLRLQVDRDLGDVDAVDRPALPRQPDGGHPLLRGVPRLVVARRRRSQPAAASAHDLVNDEHPRVGAVLGQHVLGELRGLLGCGDGAEGLTNRDDVVVDRLGQAHDGELVALLVQVCREVGRRRVGVVAADGVQHVDAVSLQPFRRHVQRVVAVLDQATLDQVCRVGQLDPAVADGAAAVLVQQAGVGAGRPVDHDVLAGQDAVVAV